VTMTKRKKDLATLRARQERRLASAWIAYARRPWVFGAPVPPSYLRWCTMVAETRAAMPRTVFARVLRRVTQATRYPRALCPCCLCMVPRERVDLRKGDEFLGWLGKGNDRSPMWGRHGKAPR
jgi:hypothetical protein